MAELNFFDTYVLMAIHEEIVPMGTFFKDRYFPTGAADIFNADKVLTEYKKGDRKMAAFVAPRVGDIPMDRRGYEIHEYTPAYIAPSRILSLDDLKKRGFGEALYPGMDAAQRAERIQRDDLKEMDDRIVRREEWMAVETMINNGCTMQEYIDDKTTGDVNVVHFYDGQTSEHTYTVASGKEWDTQYGDIFGDVKAMCKMLAYRGLPAVDLILGTDASEAIMKSQEVRERINKESGLITGTIDPKLTSYPGVAFLGTLNFNGYRLNLFEVSESYVNDNNQDTPYFPEKSALVTAPGCGHMMYGAISQIDFGATDFATHAAKRVPKFILDQPNDLRKLRLACRPLAAPQNYCPYIYAANVVSA